MSYNLIDAVNTVLRELGEPPVTSVDEQYPTLDLVLPALEQNRLKVLEERWWFNHYTEYTIELDLSGECMPPVNTIMFYPDDPELVFNGVKVTDLQGNDPSANVKGTLVLDVPFEQMPLAARRYVTYMTARDVYSTDVGVDNVMQSIMQRMQEAYVLLGRTHTRQSKVNSRRRKVLQRWRSALRS